MATITYEVSLRAGHPTGEYRRGGRLFSASTPALLAEDELTPEIREDGWLIVRPHDPERTAREALAAHEPFGWFLGRLAQALGYPDGEPIDSESILLHAQALRDSTPGAFVAGTTATVELTGAGLLYERLEAALGIEREAGAGVDVDAIVEAIAALRATADAASAAAATAKGAKAAKGEGS